MKTVNGCRLPDEAIVLEEGARGGELYVLWAGWWRGEWKGQKAMVVQCTTAGADAPSHGVVLTRGQLHTLLEALG